MLKALSYAARSAFAVTLTLYAAAVLYLAYADVTSAVQPEYEVRFELLLLMIGSALTLIAGSAIGVERKSGRGWWPLPTPPPGSSAGAAARWPAYVATTQIIAVSGVIAIGATAICGVQGTHVVSSTLYALSVFSTGIFVAALITQAFPPE